VEKGISQRWGGRGAGGPPAPVARGATLEAVVPELVAVPSCAVCEPVVALPGPIVAPPPALVVRGKTAVPVCTDVAVGSLPTPSRLLEPGVSMELKRGVLGPFSRPKKASLTVVGKLWQATLLVTKLSEAIPASKVYHK
jgi:hypothetical protein